MTLDETIKEIRSGEFPVKPKFWEDVTRNEISNIKSAASDMSFYAQRAVWDERNSTTLLETLKRAKEACQGSERAIDDMIEHVSPKQMIAAE